MGKRLERFGEVRIIDETNGFDVVYTVVDDVVYSDLSAYFCGHCMLVA